MCPERILSCLLSAGGSVFLFFEYSTVQALEAFTWDWSFATCSLQKNWKIVCYFLPRKRALRVDWRLTFQVQSVRLHRISISGVFEVCKCGCYRHYFSDTIQSKQPCIILFNEEKCTLLTTQSETWNYLRTNNIWLKMHKTERLRTITWRWPCYKFIKLIITFVINVEIEIRIKQWLRSQVKVNKSFPSILIISTAGKN